MDALARCGSSFRPTSAAVTQLGAAIRSAQKQDASAQSPSKNKLQLAIQQMTAKAGNNPPRRRTKSSLDSAMEKTGEKLPYVSSLGENERKVIALHATCRVADAKNRSPNTSPLHLENPSYAVIDHSLSAGL